jgi:hypothetical protein
LLSNNLLAFEQIKRAAAAVAVAGKAWRSLDGGLLASEMMSDSDVISHVQWT